MLMLDTHVWIWLLNGETRLERSGFLPAIEDAAKRAEVFISAISLWETAMLIRRNRISISENTSDWFKEALSAPGISVIPLSSEISVESTLLPGDFHGDPADQIIVATARVHDAALVTFDEKILKYSKKGYLRVLEKPRRKQT